MKSTSFEMERQIELSSRGIEVAKELKSLLSQNGYKFQKGERITVKLLNTLFLHDKIKLRFSEARSFLTKDLLLFMLPQGLDVEFVSQTNNSYYLIV